MSDKTTELREAARSIQGNLGRCLYRRKDVDEMRKVSDLLLEAADTIESLQGEVNHWKVEQIHAYSNWEDAYSRVKELEADKGTRYHKLFGTPERAARTLSIMQRCELGIIGNCDDCEMHDACRVRDGDYDALLEWLRGDAE